MKTVFDKLMLFSVCLREDPEYNSCFVLYITGVKWWLIDDFSFENANVIGYGKLPRPLVIPSKKNRAVDYWLIAFNNPSESWAKEEISVSLFSKGEVFHKRRKAFEYCHPAWSCMSTRLPMRGLHKLVMAVFRLTWQIRVGQQYLLSAPSALPCFPSPLLFQSLSFFEARYVIFYCFDKTPPRQVIEERTYVNLWAL